MKRETKYDLKRDNEALRKKLDTLEAGFRTGIFKYDRKEYVGVPFPIANHRDLLWETVSNRLSQVFSGPTDGSTFYEVIDVDSYNEIVPGITHVIVKADYNDNDGLYIHGIWNAIEVTA